MTPRKTLVILSVLALAAAPGLALAHGDDEEEHHVIIERSGAGHGYLGVRLQSIEGGLAEALEIDANAGVLVGQVLEGSPAEKAGLRPGDIIMEIGGEKVGSPADVRNTVRDRDPGDKVKVSVLRRGSRKSLDVALGEAPGPRTAMRRHVDGARRQLERAKDLRFHGERGYLGVATQPISGDLGEYFGVEEGRGALVSEVIEDSPAAKLGLRAGDVIVEVDGNDIDDPGDLARTIRDYEEATDVEVVWVRSGKRKSGTAALEMREGPKVFGFRDDDGAFFDWHGLPEDLHVELREPFRRVEKLVKREASVELEALRKELDELRKELQELKEEID